MWMAPKNDINAPAIARLKSRQPAIATAKALQASNFNPKEVWKEKWLNSGYNSPLFNIDEHSSKSNEFSLPRKLWCNLNRLRSGHGRCNVMLHKWKIVNDPSCPCGNQQQTMNHLLKDCPIFKYNGDMNDIKELNSQAVKWLDTLNLWYSSVLLT